MNCDDFVIIRFLDEKNVIIEASSIKVPVRGDFYRYKA